MENENYKGTSPTAAVEENHFPAAMDGNDDDAEAKERLTSNDPTKVKFISANSNYGRKNGDAKVDIENVQRNVGMSKQELMKYANEPFWVRLRMALFILFWVLWFAMLIGSVLIIVFAPRCPPAPRLDWWQKSAPYQVLVSSFKDSGKDGIGDLQGLTSKLDYFKDIGVDTLLLSPIYPTDSVDNAYDITNFVDIHQEYGTMQDFEDLVVAMKSRDQKLILEFIPNQSGDKHPWFEKSVNRQEPYTDYYVWANQKAASSPPNNWQSVEGGSAWTFHPVRQQYFLHQFDGAQPDLNLRNPLVQEEMVNILKFWLDKGVDGFRIRGASYLFEDSELRDEPKKDLSSGVSYISLDHIYTKNQQETFDLLKDWREIMSNSSSSESYKLLLADVHDNVNNSMLYYGNSSSPLVDLPLNTGLLQLSGEITGHDIFRVIQSWIAATPSDLWPNWVLGDQDNSRLATRVGDNMLDALSMITLLNKGTPLIYYGDELGMKDVDVKEADSRNRQQRGKFRTPMQWDNSSMSGFTSSSHSWLPLSEDTSDSNVMSELQDPRSHLRIFKSLMKLRAQSSIRFGMVDFPVVNDQIFSMIRVRKGSPGYLVVVNTGGNTTTVNLNEKSEQLPDTARVEVVSKGSSEIPTLNDEGNPKVELNSLHLGPKQAAVLTFVPKSQ